MRVDRNRFMAAATAVAIALTSVNFTAAAPVSKPASNDQTTVSDATDFSSKSRVKRRSSRGDAAAAAAMLGVFGIIGTIIAREQYERRYREQYYYGGPYYRGYGGDSRCPYGGVYQWYAGTGWGCY